MSTQSNVLLNELHESQVGVSLAPNFMESLILSNHDHWIMSKLISLQHIFQRGGSCSSVVIYTITNGFDFIAG